MAEKKDLLCLFDVDGTLTPSRLVGEALMGVHMFTLQLQGISYRDGAVS